MPRPPGGEQRLTLAYEPRRADRAVEAERPLELDLALRHVSARHEALRGPQAGLGLVAQRSDLLVPVGGASEVAGEVRLRRFGPGAVPARAEDAFSVLAELERRDDEVGKVEPGASFQGLEEGEGLIECLTSFVHASHEHEHPP